MTTIPLRTTTSPATLIARPAWPARRPPAAIGLPRPIEREWECGRRVLNVIVAALGLVLAAPIIFIIAALVKLSSPGPVIYRQTRVGLDRRLRHASDGMRRRADTGGRPFTIYKFRTMSVQEGAGGAEVWASPADPRVTRVGRIFRQYRLDELPQLWNVLIGDMNVVGPRPEQPRIVADLRKQVGNYALRQQVRPGITGWAQINHHYDSSVDDVRRKVSLDLEYIERQSMMEDLWIMVRTVPVVMFKYGAW